MTGITFDFDLLEGANSPSSFWNEIALQGHVSNRVGKSSPFGVDQERFQSLKQQLNRCLDPRRDPIPMMNRWLRFKIHRVSRRNRRFVPLLEITKQKL